MQVDARRDLRRDLSRRLDVGWWRGGCRSIVEVVVPDELGAEHGLQP